ncbi:MAG TPA: hypothetical protein VJT74_14395, partial [Pyrinomonadaceae bacterium]|nr:hypothetical protein [Pyrinomonadaceae bacterium]
DVHPDQVLFAETSFQHDLLFSSRHRRLPAMELPQTQARLARSRQFAGFGLGYLASGFHCGLDATNVHGLMVPGRE